MNDVLVGLFGIVALFGLMAFRTPVAFAMLLVGFFGMWVLIPTAPVCDSRGIPFGSAL